MQKFFDLFGGKTKFFAGLGFVAVAAETAGFVPVGATETAVALVQALAGVGVVFGFRDAVSKIRS